MRIVLSYVPFIKDLGNNFESMTSAFQARQEGLYKQDEGRDMQYQDRLLEQEELKAFLSKVFEKKKMMSFNDYLEFNRNVSSEMFFSLMTVLHENLPCS